jgi:hypothetical protein
VNIRESFTERTGEALAERIADDGFYTSYNTLGAGVGPDCINCGLSPAGHDAEGLCAKEAIDEFHGMA